MARNVFSWHPSETHLVYGLFERHIGTLQPKKVPNPLLQYNLIQDNHKSVVFSVLGKFLAWELFLVAIYLCVFQINHKPSVSQMGATK